MINQEYTGINLCQFTTPNERRYFLSPSGGLPARFTREELIKQLDSICDNIYDQSYSFSLTYQGDLLKNSHPRYSIEYLAQNLLLRQLHAVIGRIYSARQTNRQAIVRYIKDFLFQHCPFDKYSTFILRLDIRQFYPSIDKDRLISRLKGSSLLSPESLFLLDGILSKSTRGLPLGISVSASLSEYAMEKFDKTIIRTNGVLYLALIQI